MALLHQITTDRIIRAFYNVYNELGYGFIEKIYERALIVELQTFGLSVESQRVTRVFYKNQDLGNYVIDIVVGGVVLLELKAVNNVLPAHEKQLQNYLKATSIEVGLLLNFGPRPEVVRKIFTNDRKKLSGKE